MPGAGAVRYVVEIVASRPARVTGWRGVRVDEFGFTAKRAITSWPVEMPPRMPPARLELKATRLPWRRIASAFSSPLSAAASRPAPISTARSEEHTSELQSLMRISYAVFCLKKQKYERHHQL